MLDKVALFPLLSSIIRDGSQVQLCELVYKWDHEIHNILWHLWLALMLCDLHDPCPSSTPATAFPRQAQLTRRGG